MDAAIHVEFTEGMDTNSFQSRFGIYMGNLEEIPTNMMGQMNGMMDGHFQWTDDQTMMTSHPDEHAGNTIMIIIWSLQGAMRWLKPHF